MAEKKKVDKWWFVTWEERHRTRPFAVDVYNSIIEEHPVDFLIEARKATRFKVSLLFAMELDASSSQVAAWNKKLKGED